MSITVQVDFTRHLQFVDSADVLNIEHKMYSTAHVTKNFRDSRCYDDMSKQKPTCELSWELYGNTTKLKFKKIKSTKCCNDMANKWLLNKLTALIAHSSAIACLWQPFYIISFCLQLPTSRLQMFCWKCHLASVVVYLPKFHFMLNNKCIRRPIAEIQQCEMFNMGAGCYLRFGPTRSSDVRTAVPSNC